MLQAIPWRALQVLSRHDIGVHHHVSQPAIPFAGVFGVEGANGMLLPILQPMVPRHPTVVLVHLAVTLAPVVELALADAQPPDQPLGRQDYLGAVTSIDREVGRIRQVRKERDAESNTLIFFCFSVT